MSQQAGLIPWFSADRKLGGATRLLLGFIIGALFALLPMYYFYMGREAALRNTYAQAQPMTLADTARPGGAEPIAGEAAGKPFASRMTYELSQLPEEPPAAPPKPRIPPLASAQPARAPTTPVPAPAPQQEEAVGS